MTRISRPVAGPHTIGRRAALMLSMGLLPVALAGCSGADKKTIVTGKQIPVLPESGKLTAALDAPPVTLPAPLQLTDWPQVFAGPAHAPGNIAGPAGLSQNWRADIGAAGGYRQPLSASPLLADGRVFAMDANAVVTGLAATSGRQQWRRDTRPKHMSSINIGGGLAYGAGVLYASTGYGELLAFDAASGIIKWRQTMDFPARSAPSIAGNVVAVVVQNDLLLTFDAATGTPGWRFTGKVTDSPTSVSISGPPAFDSGILVAGFSSGTLAALDINSGTPLWEESFASAYGQASPLDFSDIVAAPVISGGVVYAIGLGQSLQAVDLHSGAKVWSKDSAGSQTICAAGDFVYVLDTSQLLAAIHADDGLVSWTLQMPAFKNPKKHRLPIQWTAPVMVNNMLVLLGDNGEMAMVDPLAGAIQSTRKISGPADLPPIAAAGLMLLLTRNATLTAYS